MEYKGFRIVLAGTFGMREVKPIGKGSVPKELRGRYTSETEAMKAIDFQESRKKKGQKNGEAAITD